MYVSAAIRKVSPVLPKLRVLSCQGNVLFGVGISTDVAQPHVKTSISKFVSCRRQLID